MAPKPRTGTFANGMDYACWGNTSRAALNIPGGPGSQIPKGIGLRLMLNAYKRLVEAGYTVWMVGRKQGMAPGHTVRDMANDYAQIIEAEFGGEVDLVFGTSYGGIIGQYLAVDHPRSFRRIVLVGAACEVSGPGKEADLAFARAMGEGRPTDGGTIMAGALLPRVRFEWMRRAAGWVIGRLMTGSSEHYARDIVIEGEAEVNFDSRHVLSSIKVPVLLIVGDRDSYFPMNLVEETVDRIPNCTLRVYEGRTHMGVFNDKRLAQDILDWVNA